MEFLNQVKDMFFDTCRRPHPMTMLPLSIENVEEEGCESTLSSRLESWTRRYLKVSLSVSLSLSMHAHA